MRPSRKAFVAGAQLHVLIGRIAMRKKPVPIDLDDDDEDAESRDDDDYDAGATIVAVRRPAYAQDSVAAAAVDEDVVPPRLLDVSLDALLVGRVGGKRGGGGPPVATLELLLRRGLVSRTWQNRILSSALLAARRRPLLVRIVLRYWSERVLSLQTLAERCPTWHTVMRAAFDGRLKALDTVANAVVVVTEEFLSGVTAFPARSQLQVLDFRLCPIMGRTSLGVRKLVERAEDVLLDWTPRNPEAHIKIPLELVRKSDINFWQRHFQKIPNFVKISKLKVLSPLVTGSDHMTTLSRHFDKDLSEVHLRDERLFNRDGLFETDVDHLRDILVTLYRQESPIWQLRLRRFQNLVSLSLYCPGPAVAACERAAAAIAFRPRELRRLSPSAVNQWAEALSQLTRLRHLSLRGNFIQNCMEVLLKNASFSLRSINVEDCELSERDLDFLARSKQVATLKDISLGDLDMGEKFEAILNLVKSVVKLEALNLCLEGHYRYRTNICFNEQQALELLFSVCTMHKTCVRSLNLAGHAWSKEFILKVAKRLVPLPNLRSLVLPVDGLGEATLEEYTEIRLRNAALAAGVAEDAPVEDVSLGMELRLLRVAVRQYMEDKYCYHRLTVHTLSDGLLFLMA